ncbi:MAG: transketolase [Burkholderiaceae bacterium]
MRKQFCDAMVVRGADPRMVFLSGDLGFMALEPLQAALGERFVNAGVAEQNMVSVAAALSRTGLEAWVYSIAPFVTARPFEQIRNDVALHALPVRIVGNGGGYGYGVMGPTHHAIEDYGTLLSLGGMRACVPAFDEDVAAAVQTTGDTPTPFYLRLGRGEPPPGYVPPPFEAWRQLTRGGGPSVVAVGPLVGTYIAPLQALPEATRPNLWVVGLLPLAHYLPPPEFFQQLAHSCALLVVEEHVARGGFASELALNLASSGLMPRRFRHLCARAARFEAYGSQSWLRHQSGLDVDTVVAAIAQL